MGSAKSESRVPESKVPESKSEMPKSKSDSRVPKSRKSRKNGLEPQTHANREYSPANNLKNIALWEIFRAKY